MSDSKTPSEEPGSASTHSTPSTTAKQLADKMLADATPALIKSVTEYFQKGASEMLYNYIETAAKDIMDLQGEMTDGIKEALRGGAPYDYSDIEEVKAFCWVKARSTQIQSPRNTHIDVSDIKDVKKVFFSSVQQWDSRIPREKLIQDALDYFKFVKNEKIFIHYIIDARPEVSPPSPSQDIHTFITTYGKILRIFTNYPGGDFLSTSQVEVLELEHWISIDTIRTIKLLTNCVDTCLTVSQTHLTVPFNVVVPYGFKPCCCHGHRRTESRSVYIDHSISDTLRSTYGIVKRERVSDPIIELLRRQKALVESRLNTPDSVFMKRAREIVVENRTARAKHDEYQKASVERDDALKEVARMKEFMEKEKPLLELKATKESVEREAEANRKEKERLKLMFLKLEAEKAEFAKQKDMLQKVDLTELLK